MRKCRQAGEPRKEGRGGGGFFDPPRRGGARRTHGALKANFFPLLFSSNRASPSPVSRKHSAPLVLDWPAPAPPYHHCSFTKSKFFRFLGVAGARDQNWRREGKEGVACLFFWGRERRERALLRTRRAALERRLIFLTWIFLFFNSLSLDPTSLFAFDFLSSE